jgi:tripartite-type tricarboxylate transporter receptor subunit TctC
MLISIRLLPFAATRSIMMLTRRTFIGLLGALYLATPPKLGLAAQWPSRPVRVVYPYAAGSPGDVTARLFAQRFSEVFGQAFVIENRTGANGLLAVAAVAGAPADGQTLLWAASPPVTISPAMTKVPYDPVKDFAPISAVSISTFALIVNEKMPVKSIAEFVSFVRARPKELAYAEGGVGSTNHLAMALFLNRAGLHMTNVSYRGSGPALTDVIAGHVPTMFSPLPDLKPHVERGAIRVLAVTGEQRSPYLPDVSTFSESGFPGFKVPAWSGLMAPAGTPKPIVERLAAEVVRAIKDSTFADQLNRRGIESLGTTPEEFAAMIATDIALCAEAVKIAGIQLK